MKKWQPEQAVNSSSELNIKFVHKYLKKKNTFKEYILTYSKTTHFLELAAVAQENSYKENAM